MREYLQRVLRLQGGEMIFRWLQSKWQLSMTQPHLQTRLGSDAEYALDPLENDRGQGALGGRKGYTDLAVLST